MFLLLLLILLPCEVVGKWDLLMPFCPFLQKIHGIYRECDTVWLLCGLLRLLCCGATGCWSCCLVDLLFDVILVVVILVVIGMCRRILVHCFDMCRRKDHFGQGELSAWVDRIVPIHVRRRGCCCSCNRSSCGRRLTQVLESGGGLFQP